MDTNAFVQRGATIAIDAAAYAELHVRRGRVWLTQEDGRDYVLIDGQRFTLKKEATALVTALQPSLLEIYRADPGAVRARLEREAPRHNSRLFWAMLKTLAARAFSFGAVMTSRKESGKST